MSKVFNPDFNTCKSCESGHRVHRVCDLPFHEMPVLERIKTKGGEIVVVRCTEYKPRKQ